MYNFVFLLNLQDIGFDQHTGADQHTGLWRDKFAWPLKFWLVTQLNYHLSKVNRTVKPICPLCEEENVSHLLGQLFDTYYTTATDIIDRYNLRQIRSFVHKSKQLELWDTIFMMLGNNLWLLHWGKVYSRVLGSLVKRLSSVGILLLTGYRGEWTGLVPSAGLFGPSPTKKKTPLVSNRFSLITACPRVSNGFRRLSILSKLQVW